MAWKTYFDIGRNQCTMCFYKKHINCNILNSVKRYFSTGINTDVLEKVKTPLLNVSSLSRLPSGVCGHEHCDNLTSFRRSFTSMNSCAKRNISNSVGLGASCPSISRRLDAERMIRGMTDDELQLLCRSLKDLEEERILGLEQVTDDPTLRQLMIISFNNSIPFIGFGFLDNAIMISAGDYIDSTIGVSLGISTMAAAAIGNMVSDMAGIGLAGYVEILAQRFGIVEPKLTAQQLTLGSTKRAEYAGRGVGIAIGCFIGMFPLLLLHNNNNDSNSDKTK